MQIKKLLATLGVAGAMILSGCAGTYDSEVGWATPVEEDMVVTCSMSLETGDIKESSTFARKTVGDAGGKVTQYDVFDTSAGLTFDVPADKLDEVMDKLAEHDKVLSENMSGYIDDKVEAILLDEEESIAEIKEDKEDKVTLYCDYQMSSLDANWHMFMNTLSNTGTLFGNFFILLATFLVYTSPLWLTGLVIFLIIYLSIRQSKKKEAQKK